MKKFGIVEDIPPLDKDLAMRNLINDTVDFMQSLYALLPQAKTRRIYRTRSYEHLIESIKEAEISLGTRRPRTQIVPVAGDTALREKPL